MEVQSGDGAGKYETTGHGSLVVCDESGDIIFVSGPAPGCDHDMNKLNGEAKEILELAGGVVADKGFQDQGTLRYPGEEAKGPRPLPARTRIQ